MRDEVILQILRRSPQGFTQLEILDQLLALPLYKGCSKSRIFAVLLPILEHLRDSQVVAHVYPRWVLIEAPKNIVNSDTHTKDTQSPIQLEINFSVASENCANDVAVDLPIELLNLSVRTYNPLIESDIKTIGELRNCSDEELLTIWYFGQTSLAEVRSALANFQPPLQATQTQEVSQLPKCANDVAVDLPIELLNLSGRTYNSLIRSYIKTIGELRNWSDKELLLISNFGQTSLAEVHSALANFQPPSQATQTQPPSQATQTQPPSQATQTQPPSQATQTQEVSQLPKWASLPGMQISTSNLALSLSLYLMISEEYFTVAHLIYEFEAENITLDSQQYAEITAAITPFRALRNAPQDYLDWLVSLSKSSSLVKVLTVHQWTPDKLKELFPSQILSGITSDVHETTHQAIISGKIPFKSILTIAEEVQDWLYSLTLTKQQQYVLEQRLGFQNGNPKTLAALGLEMKKSGKTVRQIEIKAIRKLNATRRSMLWQLKKVAIETLRSAGCICTLEDWCEAISQVYPPGEIHLPSVISWIVDFLSGISSIEIYNKKFFYIEPLTESLFSDIQAQFKKFWEEEKIGDRPQLYQIILPLLPEDILNPEQVADTLIKNLYYEPIPGMFSAKEWNIPDYAYYVLYDVGKPLHFSEIGQIIKQLKPDWKAENLERSAQGVIERHPEIIRCGSGIYGLREWGTMEYSHFREVLLDYLSKQPLPVDAEDIFAELSQLYSVTQATVSMNLSLNPNLFYKFGRSNFYGVAGRRYELPDENLLSLLIEKLKDSSVSLLDLEQDAELSEYDFRSLLLYLNVSPLFYQIGSNKERKFALSIDGKRQFQPGDCSKIVAEIFNQICEPLHPRDFPHFIRNYYAYPPRESAFWRTLSEGKDYIKIAEAIFIPRDWMNDEALSLILEELDTELLRDIIIFTVGSKRQKIPADILLDWLNFCYRNRFFYRGSLVYAQINLSEVPVQKANIAQKIGKVCQRNGDTSVLAIGQDANSEEVDRRLRLDLEELRQQAQSRQRTPSKGLASIPDGKYRVRYVGVGVEVHLAKSGGTDNPCAKVIKVMVNGELFDPNRHNPIPTNTTSIDHRQEALKNLYNRTLNKYGQVAPYLQVAIGQRPSWGSISYRNMELITESETGDFT